MTFEIYALREIGSLEVRYVGQTGKGKSVRLNFLAALARCGQGELDIRAWFKDCRFNVEAIQIGTATTREEAKAIERLAIQVFWAAGHRLFNRQGVPKTALAEPYLLGRRRMAEAA